MKQAPKSNPSKPGSNHSITGILFMNDLLFILEKEKGSNRGRKIERGS